MSVDIFEFWNEASNVACDNSLKLPPDPPPIGQWVRFPGSCKGRDNKAAAISNLRIVSQEQYYPSMPDLSCIEGQHLFERVINDADLIIVDNVSTLCRTGVENKSDDWNFDLPSSVVDKFKVENGWLVAAATAENI